MANLKCIGKIETNELKIGSGDKLNNIKLNGKFLLDIIYPVGSIYISTNSQSPASLFGGSWSQILGRFLLGTGAVESNTSDWVGGVTANSYNVTPGERGGIFDHSHLIPFGYNGSLQYSISNAHQGQNIVESLSGGYLKPTKFTNTTAQICYSEGTRVLPPYLAVYMWKRTA